MISTILEKITAHLEAKRAAGQLPGVQTVKLGDDLPDATNLQPLLSVDWESEQFEEGFGTGQPLTHEIYVRLYVSQARKGEFINGTIRKIYESGLRAALLRMPANCGFLLQPIEARKFNQQERPEGRFSAGLAVRCSVRSQPNR